MPGGPVPIAVGIDAVARELVAIEDDLGADADYCVGFRDALEVLRDAAKHGRSRHLAKDVGRSGFFKMVWRECHQPDQQKDFGLHMEDNDTYVWDSEEHYYRLRLSDDFHAELFCTQKGTGLLTMHKYAERTRNRHGGWEVRWKNAPDAVIDMRGFAKALKEV